MNSTHTLNLVHRSGLSVAIVVSSWSNQSILKSRSQKPKVVARLPTHLFESAMEVDQHYQSGVQVLLG